MKLTRRKTVLARLERQLSSGVKLNKDEATKASQPFTSLSEHDRERITKEIGILKSRI